jgi:hypothetical protein
MVNPVGFSPQQAAAAQSNAAQAQEVRQRNEQTQPRQAPPAQTQQNTLQTRGDDQRRQGQQLGARTRQFSSGGTESQGSTKRGQLLDVVA